MNIEFYKHHVFDEIINFVELRLYYNFATLVDKAIFAIDFYLSKAVAKNPGIIELWFDNYIAALVNEAKK